MESNVVLTTPPCNYNELPTSVSKKHQKKQSVAGEKAPDLVSVSGGFLVGISLLKFNVALFVYIYMIYNIYYIIRVYAFFLYTHQFTTMFGVSFESLDRKVTFFQGSHRGIVRSHHSTKTVASSHVLPHQEQRFPEVTRHRV